MISNPTEIRRERGTRQKIHPLRSNISFARVHVLFYPSRSREHLHPGLISTAHMFSSSPRFGNGGESVRKKSQNWTPAARAVQRERPNVQTFRETDETNDMS